MRRTSFGKALLRTVVSLIVLALTVVAGYAAYVMIAFHRLGDQPLAVEGAVPETVLETDRSYTVLSFNIGFGAYEPDYGFFMDGGTESRAWSRTRLNDNLARIAVFLEEQRADAVLLQEVDFDSTRTYRVDERVYFTSALKNFAYTYAQNYDSPYLFYPITKPHGASHSGLLTFSSFPIASAERVELPIETGFTKFLDLDRCYAKNRIPLDNGKDLVLYNFHLSAYTSDGTIATEQLKRLLLDMKNEYEKGCFAIAGGDFNKDLLGNSSDYFGKPEKTYLWAQPIPEGLFDGTHVTLVAPFDADAPVPSCRNADGPYHKGQFVLTIDGFLVTDNVTAEAARVIDTGFAYSDHNPVEMTFRLKS